MKKIFYLLTAFTMVFFTSCNELDDVYDELDAVTENNGIIGDVTRTLSDEDYETLELSFGNFSSEDEAKEALPAFLSSTYPALGVVWSADGSVEQASSALITYKLFDPISYEEYTVTDADYTTLGLTSLNDSDDFNDLLGSVFSGVAKGTVVDLTYDTEPSINNYTLTNEDYDLVGNGNFDNFDIREGRSEETLESRIVKIQTILLNNFPEAEEGTIYNVTYEVFDGTTFDLEILLVQQQNEPDTTLTTNYTLTEADYALVGNGNFNNFDIRSGSDEETIESRRAKIETILLNNFPSATSGDLYNVTYEAFAGFDVTEPRPILDLLVEFDGTTYNIFDLTSYEIYTFELEEATTRFTLVNEWAAPITFTDEEYAFMGQNFPNFSDEDEALRIIGIYLETLYPFAAADDFVAVEYDFFVSGSGVSQENVNYVFDGTVWNNIPTVIEAELQFGHDGINWVPDNTIKYTLTNADFESVGNGQFNNFDVRPGNDEETIEARLAKINTILLANFPEYAEGQKVSVSYAVWEPGDAVYIMNVIHNGTEYVLQ